MFTTIIALALIGQANPDPQTPSVKYNKKENDPFISATVCRFERDGAELEVSVHAYYKGKGPHRFTGGDRRLRNQAGYRSWMALGTVVC
jgi:hypothetical protein